MHGQIYDLTKIDMPELAYLSGSETPIRANSKAYTHGFEYTLVEWSQMHTVTAKYSYSTMIFKNGHRLKENVIGYGNICIFDIDNKPNEPGYTAQQVVGAVKGLRSLVVSTRSHTSKNHRLRLILLADKILNKDVSSALYKEIMYTIIDFCGLDAGMLDTSCFSTDRQYAPNPLNQKQYYMEGDLLPMEFIVKLAEESLKSKNMKKVTCKPFIVNGAAHNLKQKRSFIKNHLSVELMGSVLEEYGLVVYKNGKVKVPNNPTDALHIDLKTGLLRDFANDISYDPVSVLVDHYGIPIAEATNYIYEKAGGL